jgi:phosphatidylserine/phosphatidylglycerophosphate/cardiolipin synthase-like enzyme
MLDCRTRSQADVYVGTGAGSPVYHDIAEARHSVRVISPYLGEHLVTVLLGCQERGLEVRAIVSNDGGNAQDLARLLVVQTGQIDRDRQRLSRYGSLFGVLALIVALAVLVFAALQRSLALAAGGVLLGVLAVLIVLFFGQLAIYVYSYSYRLGGLRVVPSPRCYPYGLKETAPPFVHAKLYVIDDRVAYLGSANFTTSGLFDNLEAMVRLTSPDAVAKLGRYIDELFARGPLPAYPPSAWARPFFREYRALRIASAITQGMPPVSTPVGPVVGVG